MMRFGAWLLMLPAMTSVASYGAVPLAQDAHVGNAHTPCAEAAYRQLDFRLGSFDVTTGTGVQAGKSHVETILGGCALVEHWMGAVSGAGEATFAYDSADERWHMTFINSEGHHLRMAGTFAGDALVLVGENMTFDGRRALQRMTWSPLPKGHVLQVWELSMDDGLTWQPFFEGHYARLP